MRAATRFNLTGLPQGGRTELSRSDAIAGAVACVLLALVVFAVLDPWGGDRNRPAARRVVCASNLRYLGDAAKEVANEAPRVPSSDVRLVTLCDQTPEYRDLLLGRFVGRFVSSDAAKQAQSYCPGTEASPDALWTRAGGRSTWGYVWFNDRGGARGELPESFPPREPPLRYFSRPEQLPRSGMDSILALDLLVSPDRDTLPTVRWAPSDPGFPTNHLDSRLHSGGNLLIGDGHVEWRDFKAAGATVIVSAGGGVFWVPKE